MTKNPVYCSKIDYIIFSQLHKIWKNHSKKENMQDVSYLSVLFSTYQVMLDQKDPYILLSSLVHQHDLSAITLALMG